MKQDIFIEESFDNLKTESFWFFESDIVYFDKKSMLKYLLGHIPIFIIFFFTIQSIVELFWCLQDVNLML